MMEFDASASKTSFSPYYQQKNVNQKSLDNLKETTPSTHLPNRSPLQLLTLPQRLPLQNLNLLLLRCIVHFGLTDLIFQLDDLLIIPFLLTMLEFTELSLETCTDVSSGLEAGFRIAEVFERASGGIELLGEGSGEGAFDELEVG